MTMTKNREHAPTLKNFIGGKWVEASGSKTEEVPNPANGNPWLYVGCTPDNVEQAIAAARNAFQNCAEPRAEAARIMFRYQQLLVEHWDELARVVTWRTGRVIRSYGEVQRGHRMRRIRRRAPTLNDGKPLPDIGHQH